MIHFNKPVFLLIIAVTAFCSCSQSEDFTAQESRKEPVSDNCNIVFRLQSNYSAITRSAEDSYSHVQGTASEYKVNNARVYLYNNQSKLFAKSFLLANLTHVGSDANGNITYESDKFSVAPGVYDIFVTANTDRVINKTNEDDFLADIDSVTYIQGQIVDISNGIVMSNRASANVQVTITKKDGDEPNVVNITLERVLARLDIAKSAEQFEMTDKNGAKYATVTLDGFYIVNQPKYYYSYRHTAVLTSLDEPQWNINTNFGNVADVNGYVVDPYFFKKAIDASAFTNADKYYENAFVDLNGPNAAKWTSFNAVSSTPNYKTSYCLENCMYAPAQKNGYSTGVVFKAIIEPNNNVYHLNSSNTLELITDKTKYPEVLYYFEYKFYDSADALKVAVAASSSPTSALQAKKFEKTDDGYRCYYNYWIRHLDNNNPTIMGVMEFGVIRNNLYRMLITNVSDLGEEDMNSFTPDTPDEGEAYMNVVLNVKPWIVRDLTNIVL